MNRQITILLLIFIIIHATIAQEQRNLLSNQIDSTLVINTTFLPSKETIQNKLASISEEEKEKIITAAEQNLDYTWPTIPATAYLAFKITGDREVMQDYQNKKSEVLKSFVLAELIENKGRFLDGIINGSWSICEQTTWVLSAHLPSQKGGAGVPNIEEPIIDLGAGEIASLLGWTFHFFKDDFKEISPFLYNRIPFEIKNRIINPYLERDDFWWMAFKKDTFVNNWNPWCNYNSLLSTILLGEEVTIETQKAVLTKSMKSVDKFINYYKADGACEEGPSYWSHAGGKMLEYLEFVYNLTDGTVSVRDNKLIQNMGVYIMDAHIDEDFYINFADASVRANPNPAIIYRYGTYTNNQALKQFAAYLAKNNNFYETITAKGGIDQIVNNLEIKEDLKATIPEKINKLSFAYQETEIVGGRTSIEENKGFFFAAKGGYNDESHNHNDAGSFILYYKGKPLIADIGVEIYSKKTFSDDRYEIWTMQSNYHNLPLINGVAQAYGKKYQSTQTSFSNTKSLLTFSLNIKNAYPEDASCEFFKRNYVLDRSHKSSLEITDSFQLKSFKNPTTEHFITASKPILVKDGQIKLNESVVLQYPKDIFKASIEILPLEDKRLLKSWQQENLYRIVLTTKSTELANKWVFKILKK